MKKLMTVLTFILCLQVHAVDESTCISEGSQYLIPFTGIQSINAGCNTLFDSSTSEVNKHISEDGKIDIHTYKNIIFMKVWDDTLIPPAFKEHYTTGPQSELSEVHFLEVDEVDRYLVVIANADRSIYTYRLEKGGNVGWVKKVESADFSTATAVSTDSTSGHLMVLYKDDGKIIFYKRYADIRGTRAENSTEVQGELSGVNTGLVNPVDACVDDSLSELYVFDGNDNKIRVFNQGQMGDVAPKRVITPSSLPVGATVKMDCHNIASKLSLTDGSGNNVLISR
ncbi:MAG: hypothetical protein EP326_05650 [Deltaproteobacteria bacterium]|nr:MAG: hypothetical protein EP326_05650 [Deltaproteobacteria bacterium]